MRRFSGLHLRQQRREGITLEDLSLDDCALESCSLRDSILRRVSATNTRAWACQLHGVTLEEVVVEDLSATLSGGGGRRMPILLFGPRFKKVILRGRVGSLVVNAPWKWLGKDWSEAALSDYRDYYAPVEWALDISHAHFSSVPSLRFVPGELVRIDPARQAIVHRRDAFGVDLDKLGDLGVWRTVIAELLRRPWPDAAVLASGGSARKLDEQLRALHRLREAGVAH